MATLTPEAAPGAPPRLGRPFGVYVIVCLQLLHVVSVLLEAERIPYDVSGLLLPEYVGAGAPAVSYAGAALLVIVSVGLWLLKRWAWVATMFLTGVWLASGIVRYWQGTPAYVGMVINVLIVMYLNQRAVQQAFQQGPPQPAGPPSAPPLDRPGRG